jgi:hypothetical protein
MVKKEKKQNQSNKMEKLYEAIDDCTQEDGEMNTQHTNTPNTKEPI